MGTANKDSLPLAESAHVPGLEVRSKKQKVWWINTSFYGKRVRISTGTRDLAEAQRILQKMRDEAIPSPEYILALPTKRRRMRRRDERLAQGWPQPALGNDPLARSQRDALYASKEWRRRIRSMIEAKLSGTPLQDAADAQGLSAITAIQWMIRHVPAWVFELVDGRTK